MAMLPKGDEPMGNYECSCSPDCLRPLAMKNNDIKIIASATNRILSSVASDTEEEQQTTRFCQWPSISFQHCQGGHHRPWHKHQQRSPQHDALLRQHGRCRSVPEPHARVVVGYSKA
eukprot:1409876-Pyramimonas_sp.AAC.1